MEKGDRAERFGLECHPTLCLVGRLRISGTGLGSGRMGIEFSTFGG